MKVVVVGLGYVGLPLAVRAAEVGHDVAGVDLDLRKIEALRLRYSYVEDVTSERVEAVSDAARFRAELGWSSSVKVPNFARDFDVAIIAVPTPLTRGEPDLSYVESAGAMLGRALSPDSAVVLESTTYPGTTEGLLREVLETKSGLKAGRDFHLGFSPERIDPGNKVYTLVNTPKLVAATTPQGLLVVKGFYDTIVDVTVPVSSPRVAELTKLFENIQANVLIALINEVAELAHDLDIDVWEMIDASMTKGHSMSYWTPGPGVGGHCLPIDPLYLAWQARTQLHKRFRFAELANEINHRRPIYVVERARQMLNRAGLSLKDTRVLVLGAAYKPNVGDTRESPAIEVVEVLKSYEANVVVVDPHVEAWQWDHSPLLPHEELYSRLDEFSIAILVTNHDAFDCEKIASQARMLLDCRNAVAPGLNVEAL